MNRFLFALDLDGTLLNSSNTVTENTIKYINKISSLGHKVIIASGRAPRAIKKIYDKLNLDTPIVCYNGAKIFDPEDLNFTDTAYKFPKEKIIEFCSEFKDIVPGIMAENETIIWTNDDDAFLFNFYIKDGMDFRLGNMEEILSEDPIIFIGKYIDTPENREKIVRIVESNTNIKVRFWDTDNYFELYYENVSKYHSILEVGKYYSIKEENIYAFGDADNDIEIISNLKNGIAMKNSSPALLSYAKTVTDFTNNEDGVIRYIKDYIIKDLTI